MTFLGTTDLARSTVFVTGASSGIGAELSRELVRRGAVVGGIARRVEMLEELVDELREMGGGAGWAEGDVTDTASLQSACERLVAELGEPDVVIANAGYNRPEGMKDFKPGRAIGIYDTNLLGFLRLVDWTLPRFLDRGEGHLVGISSVASYLGLPGNAAYSGSKAAMRYHLQSLRIQLRKRGIAVTTICPGFVESELTAKMDHRMPFMWPTDRAARVIADAIVTRCGEKVFPWQMRWLVTIAAARLVPRALVERILARA